MYEAAIEWAASRGPPNWLFVLALLTRPASWTGAAIGLVRERLNVDVQKEAERVEEGGDG